MKRLVYVVGPPAIGKSTAVAKAMESWPHVDVPRPIAHRVYVDHAAIPPTCVAVQLGGPHDMFPGTDRLSMSVLPKALDFLAPLEGLVLAEGDRLAVWRFLDGARNLGYDVTLVALTAPADVILGRSAARGSAQNESWWLGRVTKVRNLVNRWDGTLVSIDADRPAVDVAADLADVLHLGDK